MEVVAGHAAGKQPVGAGVGSGVGVPSVLEVAAEQGSDRFGKVDPVAVGKKQHGGGAVDIDVLASEGHDPAERRSRIAQGKSQRVPRLNCKHHLSTRLSASNSGESQKVWVLLATRARDGQFVHQEEERCVRISA